MQVIDKENSKINIENCELIYLTEVELNNTNGGSELSNWIWYGIGAMIGSMRYSTDEQFMLTALGH
ncbi:hypothetical protein [Flavobacterium sp. N1736]|uniref:hypothetical protein n=1 Tax=Flavobacterium sp. N1736 TaxID=2986823 RepID=UPI0022240CC4|nr:hypothetical protein [Flavobacterium sp. N1736]